MMTLVVCAVLVLAAAFLGFVYPGHRYLLERLGRFRTQGSPEPVPPVQLPSPADRDLVPTFGNIAQIPEERSPADLSLAHEFTVQEDIETRFQEFNWRLIVFEEDNARTSTWPVRRLNDFPLRFTGTTALLSSQIRTYIRPRYPVIIDWDGYWHEASNKLERTPDLQLPLINAYLGIRATDRPVIVSRVRREGVPLTGVLTCRRYGFADYHFPLDATEPYAEDSLSFLMTALVGPAKNWLWFSVARLRREVIGRNTQQEQVRAFLEEDASRREATRYANRFATLWGLREAPEPATGEAEVHSAPEETV